MFHISFQIEGKPLQFEVDSVTASSLISVETFRSTWSENPPNPPKSDLELETWRGDGPKLLGLLQARPPSSRKITFCRFC